jgi:hypothetical protein
MLAHADAAVALALALLLGFIALGTDDRIHIVATIERRGQPRQDTNGTWASYKETGSGSVCIQGNCCRCDLFADFAF